MLTAIYIEALLVDEEQADQVWDAWDARRLTDLTTTLMWLLIADTDVAAKFSVCSFCVNKPGKIHK